MIVTYTEGGFHVVTQRSHGVLAAQNAAQWKNPSIEDRWVETLLAIAEHDDAEVEPDGEAVLTKQGGPLYFNMKEYDPVLCSS